MAAAAYPSAPAQAPGKLPKAGFFIALGIFLVTAVVGGVLFVMGIREVVDAVDGAVRVSAPGQAEVSLDTGQQFVFAAVPSGSASDLVHVTVTDPAGDTLALDQESFVGDEANTDGEQFVLLGTFDVDSAGTFQFDTEGPPGTDVRVGGVDLGKVIGFIVGGIGIGFSGFVIALVLLIITLVRRSGKKKKQRAAAYNSSTSAPGQYPAQYPAPGQPQYPAPQQQWPPQQPPAPPPPPS